jgi:alkanesulfonate monooxygenase SsuD/methylene tetrahydromethanopterin reductase-like flavin-dependent oxidoreductase (luciferase family)
LEGAASAAWVTDRRQWRIGREVFVAATPSLARERARAALGRNDVQHQYPNRRGTQQMAATNIDPTMPVEAVDADYMMEHMCSVGDPQECADKMRKLYEEVGGFGTVLPCRQTPMMPPGITRPYGS